MKPEQNPYLPFITTDEPFFHRCRKGPNKIHPQQNHDSLRPTIFLDRDGVIIEDVKYLRDAKQIKFLPGVIEGLKELQQHFLLICITNQSAVARGYIGEPELAIIHNQLIKDLQEQQVFMAGLYYCPHLANGKITKYAINCDCRKPKSGMLSRAITEWKVLASKSFVIGDSHRDIESGQDHNIRGILINRGCGPLSRSLPKNTLCITTNLQEAADIIFRTSDIRTS